MIALFGFDEGLIISCLTKKTKPRFDNSQLLYSARKCGNEALKKHITINCQ